jgi:cytoskeletal protein CcmA (bactofilin family)
VVDIIKEDRDERKGQKREYDEQKITGFFDKDTEFKGDLTFKGSFRIDGYFKGTIVSDSMLVIGEQGKVEADVRAGYVVINGEIKGTIRAEDKVEIHSRGRVFGSIITPKLVVDEGAYLEANCQAGEHVASATPETEKGKEGASS